MWLAVASMCATSRYLLLSGYNFNIIRQFSVSKSNILCMVHMHALTHECCTIDGFSKNRLDSPNFNKAEDLDHLDTK